MTGDRVLVNLGCGSVWHSDWVNLDFAPQGAAVRAADLRGRLPFTEGSVDAVYHSHLLEHLDRAEVPNFLAESLRVLKPAGVLRVVVPDLAELCRLYLAALDAAEGGEPGADLLLEWSRLDLLDQMVRRQPGGAMLAFLARPDVAGKAPIAQRLSWDMLDYVAGRRVGPTQPSLAERLRRGGWTAVRRRLERALSRVRVAGLALLVRAIGGRRTADGFAEGVFRAAGEVHRWMYDRRSLTATLQRAGYAEIAQCRADESAIPGFAAFGLDMLGERPRKPGSLFLEARKPL